MNAVVSYTRNPDAIVIHYHFVVRDERTSATTEKTLQLSVDPRSLDARRRFGEELATVFEVVKTHHIPGRAVLIDGRGKKIAGVKTRGDFSEREWNDQVDGTFNALSTNWSVTALSAAASIVT